MTSRMCSLLPSLFLPYFSISKSNSYQSSSYNHHSALFFYLLSTSALYLLYYIFHFLFLFQPNLPLPFSCFLLYYPTFLFPLCCLEVSFSRSVPHSILIPFLHCHPISTFFLSLLSFFAPSHLSGFYSF